MAQTVTAATVPVNRKLEKAREKRADAYYLAGALFMGVCGTEQGLELALEAIAGLRKAGRVDEANRLERKACDQAETHLGTRSSLRAALRELARLNKKVARLGGPALNEDHDLPAHETPSFMEVASKSAISDTDYEEGCRNLWKRKDELRPKLEVYPVPTMKPGQAVVTENIVFVPPGTPEEIERAAAAAWDCCNP